MNSAIVKLFHGSFGMYSIHTASSSSLNQVGARANLMEICSECIDQTQSTAKSLARLTQNKELTRWRTTM
jgi:hypothetical protein